MMKTVVYLLRFVISWSGVPFSLNADNMRTNCCRAYSVTYTEWTYSQSCMNNNSVNDRRVVVQWYLSFMIMCLNNPRTSVSGIWTSIMLRSSVSSPWGRETKIRVVVAWIDDVHFISRRPIYPIVWTGIIHNGIQPTFVCCHEFLFHLLTAV